LVSANRVSGRISLSTMKLTPRTHWKHLKFEQGICIAWLFRRRALLCLDTGVFVLITGKTLCHVLDLFSSCGLCSIYSVSNEHFYGFQVEKTENKRHFLFFSCTFRKVHWSSDFCCCFSQFVASAKPWMVKHAFGFSYVTWRPILMLF
jgi:hypothetical protein